MAAADAVPGKSDVFALGEKLLAQLKQQLQHQRELIALLARKREAIRRADFASIQDLCRQEQRIVGSVTALERNRSACTKRMTAAVAPGRKEPLSVSGIAEALGGTLGESLCEVADELSGLLRELQYESSVVRRAADALAGHMTGIMQSVATALSTTPVYESRGRIRGGAQLEYSVDVQS